MTDKNNTELAVVVEAKHPLNQTTLAILNILNDPDLIALSNCTEEFARQGYQKVLGTAQALAGFLEGYQPQLTSRYVKNEINNDLSLALKYLRAYKHSPEEKLSNLMGAVDIFDQKILPKMSSLTPFYYGHIENSFQEFIQRLESDAEEKLYQMHTTHAAKLESIERLDEQRSQALRHFREDLSKIEKETQQKCENLMLSLQNKSEEFLGKIKKNHEDAQKIVSLIGNAGMASNYQRIANNQEKQANQWRWITLALFGAGLMMASYTFFETFVLDNPHDFDGNAVAVTLLRLLFTIVLAAPAWYCARESARHRTLADRTRQTELELAALGPFIELLPEDIKNDLREKLAPKYFGCRMEPHRINPTIDIQQLIELVSEAVKALKVSTPSVK